MKIAIVTGASSGMGRESVIQLADRFGGKLDEIWLIARRKERMEELEGRLPAALRLFSIDITDRIQLEKLKMALEEHTPQVVFLVNAAGYGKIGAVGQVSLTDELGMVQLNCQALCAVTHLVLPYMARNGRILQYASSAAFLPQPNFAIYAASKSFVLSYSRALHTELKERGICVTAVCPGPVQTEFFDIAETTGHMPAYKQLAMADPKKVVKKAIRDSMMGKTVSVYGLLMKLFFLLCRLLPHSLILAVWECMLIQKEKR
ncbi:MAG: SDR family NAD(P)-dependent oxidoreductase [Lachnospiraceae bacterium]|nr:SDR family NAD(P)-dependent oxidoreductase [Lachnospiraceae bacterium]